MTAPGPCTASELPFGKLSGSPFAVVPVPPAILTFPAAASADGTWRRKRLLPDCDVRICCCVLYEAGWPLPDNLPAACSG